MWRWGIDSWVGFLFFWFVLNGNTGVSLPGWRH
jgi:hypothetical protein